RSRLVFAPDGKAVAVGYETKDGRGVVELDPKTGAKIRKVAFKTVAAGATPVASPAFYTSDGKWLIMDGGEAVPIGQGASRLVGYLRVWERDTGVIRTLGDGPGDYFRTIALSPD